MKTVGDRYEILAELGRGTTAVVYKARDSYLDRTVAIKIFRPDIASLHDSDAALKRRFQQEAMAAGRLNHRSIVAVHDVGEIDRTPYIVMEHVHGRTLAEILAAEGPLRPDAAARLVIQLCEGLEYAHRRGIVHRDIKPGNILIGDDGVAKLTDFGIARIVGTDQTQSGAMLGTPAYMSPEQVRGLAADARSDVFALGVVLHEALTGAAPFRGDDLAAVLYQIAHVDPPSLRERAPGVPPALTAVVSRALAKAPETRYPTARALATALGQAVASARPPAGARARGARARSRVSRYRPVLGAGLAAVLLLAVVTWAGSSRRPDGAARGAAPAPRAAGAAAAAGPQAGRTTGGAAPARVPPVAKVETAPALETMVVSASPSTGSRAAETARPASRPATARPVRRPPEPPPAAAPAPATEAGSSPAAAASRPSFTPPPPPAAATACLSVNAIPFATVYVDGRRAGDTPRACLRVAPGAHRVRFEASGERSPERLVHVTARHTADEPMRLSYDFNSGRFVDE